AGIAGLIKVILALQNEEIPKHLHFERPSPNLDWSALPLYVPTDSMSWPRGDTPRIAAISSFGGSGTNSHVVLEESPARETVAPQDERPVHVLALSAKSEAALTELVERYRRFLVNTTESLADICYTSNTGRAHFAYRIAVVARDADHARHQLSHAVASHTTARVAPPETVTPEEFAAAYRAGADVDWEAFDRGYPRRKVALPTYPFQRERYWIDTWHPEEHSPFVASSHEAGCHPVLGHRLESALSEIVFERRLAADSPGLLTDHRVYGTIVVPGAYYIALMLSAARELFGDTAHEVSDVTFSQALLIPDTQSCRLQVIVRRTATGTASFQIFSRDSAAVESTAWTLHAAGGLRVMDAMAPAEPVSLHGEGETAESELFYRLLWESGIHLGATFRWVEQVWRREGEALGRMRLPSAPDESRDYVLYPGLIDSCFQVLAAALPNDGAGSTVYLPLGIGAFRIFGALPARLWCVARVTEPFATGSETCTGSLRLLDEGGAVVASVENLAVKRAPREALLRNVRRPGEDWLYCLEWEGAPRSAPALAPAALGTWMIVADSTGVAEELAALIRSHGGEVTAEFAPSITGVVHLAGLDACDPADPIACASLLHLVQAIATARPEQPPKLWIVTRNAQALPGTASLALGAAPLWGLGRVIASEHPELRPCLIDLDATEALAQLFQEITHPDAEDQIALRGGNRFAARLAPAAAPASLSDTPMQLDISSRGTLENLHYRPTSRRVPAPDEIEIRVHATGLNFRDVLNALGMYPGNPGPLGGECAGVVTAVGEEVTRFAPGDEVIAIAPGSFGTVVTTPAALAVTKHTGMTFEEAAAIPM
ncbi:MAG TPA: polyketide synthase dehydratase domain-containing protein, partial [Candidatus Acidoferrum sp.]|nr:polyketide synthase dehydratase domain-containing protein [Candidatus Acidoferrum sp.]